MMKPIITKWTILIVPCLLLFAACAPPPTALTISPASATDTPTAKMTDTPESPPTFEPCAYVWASQDLPELTKKLTNSLQAIDTAITASAYAYGEDCVYADGHSTFGAMETDYRVQVKVIDTKDEKALGDWIAKAMEVILKVSDDEAPGPMTGRVDFVFSKSDSDQLSIRVPIDIYKQKATGLTGAELFKLFYKNP